MSDSIDELKAIEQKLIAELKDFQEKSGRTFLPSVTNCDKCEALIPVVFIRRKP